jgi:hypothetical protein
MNSQDVRNWLMNPTRSYEVGVQIFELFAPAKSSAELAFFKQNMQAPAGSLHFNMLYQKVSAILPKVECLEMTQTLPSAPVQQIEIKKTPFDKSVELPKSEVSRFDSMEADVNTLPENLREKYHQNQLITAELSSLRADLEHADTDEARKELAEEICEKDNIRAANWEAIDDYYANLKPLAESIEEEVMKCKSYISRCFSSKTQKVIDEVAQKTAFLAQQGITVSIESGVAVYGKKS